MKTNRILNVIAPLPVPYPTRYVIDPVAFFAALILGPLLFTLMSFWALFIPVFALAFGGPVYLVVGTPLLLWYLRRHDGAPGDLAVPALKALGIAALFLMITAAATANKELLDATLWYIGFGLIFGPAWAYFFGMIYARLRRDFFARPRPL